MLKNYYKINEESTVEKFLKEINDKKNSRYIIFENETEFVDFREIALNVKNRKTKLKTLKQVIPVNNSENETDCLTTIIDSGKQVIKTQTGFYDIVSAYETIENQKFDFLNKKLEQIETKHEIFALNHTDKISQAKKLFKEKKINLLPVIENLKIIGELRPIDLLVNELFTTGNKDKTTYYNENHNNPLLNLPIKNIINSKPLTLPKTSTLKQTINLLKTKKLPSLIITNENQTELYSIITYKDIFRLVKQEQTKQKYTIEIVGKNTIYPDELQLIEQYAHKTMEKLTSRSQYNNLKITLKTIGNTTGTHIRKIHQKLLLSHGKHILTTEKETSSSIYEEEIHSHQKENWNIPKTTQEALKTLEKQVKTEKQKHK